jgi:hypothetical protein
MAKSTLEKAIEKAQPEQVKMETLTWVINHWRQAWRDNITAALKNELKPSDVNDHYKRVIILGLAYQHISDGYGALIKSELGLSTDEFNKIDEGMGLLHSRLYTHGRTSTKKSLTGNLYDRIRQISR